MKLRDKYEKIYKDIKKGKYDISVINEESFKMKTSISFIDLLKECDKQGVDIESVLQYIKNKGGF